MALNMAVRDQRPPVRGILLDVNETLFSLSGLRNAFESCGLDPALVALWFARVLRDGFALAAAGDFKRFSDVAGSSLIALDPQRLGAADARTVLNRFHTLEPYPDVAQGLQRMRAAGIRVMTLTVGDAALAEALFARAGLRHLVDGFLSCDTVRRWKPAPEPYAYGVAQIGWPAANVALIAAHDWDVHGARRAGLQTGYIARDCAAASPVFHPADVAGNDLPTVVERLLSRK
ncbi:MAG: haloacid dehalogenase type II [Caldilineaceae bacterium]